MERPPAVTPLKSDQKPILFFYRFSIPFWIDFWSHLGAFWDPLWRQIGPSSVQDAFSSSIFFKHVIFTKTLKIHWFVLICQPQMDPKRPKTGPKPIQDGPQSSNLSCWILASTLDRFGLRFGSILGAFRAPRSVQNRTQNRSKNKLRQYASTGPPREALRPPQELPRPPQDRPKSSQDHPKSLPNSPKRAQNPSKRLQDRPKKPPRPSQSNRFWIVLNNHYFLTKQKFWKFARSHQGDPRSCQDQRASEPPHIWASRPPSACRQLPRRDSRSANNLDIGIPRCFLLFHVFPVAFSLINFMKSRHRANIGAFLSNLGWNLVIACNALTPL